jgi:hypothetical protein
VVLVLIDDGKLDPYRNGTLVPSDHWGRGCDVDCIVHRVASERQRRFIEEIDNEPRYYKVNERADGGCTYVPIEPPNSWRKNFVEPPLGERRGPSVARLDFNFANTVCDHFNPIYNECVECLI